MRDACVALVNDFYGCDDTLVDLIKANILAHVCAPEYRTATAVSLYAPFRLGDGDDNASIVVRALFTRGDASVTFTTVVDEWGCLHVFPA